MMTGENMKNKIKTNQESGNIIPNKRENDPISKIKSAGFKNWKKIIISIIIIAVLAFSLFFFISKKSENKETYQFAQVEKGNIKTTVTCTGPIDAQKTVQVGTQVSGTISKLYVDFNSKVRKNQILAQLDTTLLEIAVSQANANLAKANSQYEVDKKEL